MNLPISTSSNTGLILAGIFGVLFGIILNKARVTDYNVIVNFFRLKDMTMLKVMLAAIATGSAGIFLFNELNWISGCHIKDTNILALLTGGLVFGTGMVIYGYCPGTGIAAAATGSIHALIGFFGMLAGGIVYAFSFPWLNKTVLTVGSYGKIRLSDITPLPSPVWIALIILATIFAYYWFDKRRPT